MIPVLHRVGGDPFGEQDSDELLVRRSQAGDNSAFAELYLRHYDQVLGYCRSRLRNPDAAADAADEVFARAWKALEHLGGPRNFGGWTRTIAANLCSDIQRRAARLVATPNLDRFEGEAPHADEELMHSVELELLRQALERLSSRHREILELREARHWSYDRIAHFTHLDPDAVKSLIWRARQALRREYRALEGALAIVVVRFGHLGQLLGHARRAAGRSAEVLTDTTARSLAAAAGNAASVGIAAATTAGVVVAAGLGAGVLHHRAPPAPLAPVVHVASAPPAVGRAHAHVLADPAARRPATNPAAGSHDGSDAAGTGVPPTSLAAMLDTTDGLVADSGSQASASVEPTATATTMPGTASATPATTSGTTAPVSSTTTDAAGTPAPATTMPAGTVTRSGGAPSTAGIGGTRGGGGSAQVGDTTSTTAPASGSSSASTSFVFSQASSSATSGAASGATTVTVNQHGSRSTNRTDRTGDGASAAGWTDAASVDASTTTVGAVPTGTTTSTTEPAGSSGSAPSTTSTSSPMSTSTGGAGTGPGSGGSSTGGADSSTFASGSSSAGASPSATLPGTGYAAPGSGSGYGASIVSRDGNGDGHGRGAHAILPGP